jgi:hypothetical protein
MLARIWGGVLALDDIGRREDFFDLGGDSLMASVSAAWLQAESDVELDIGMFVNHSTIEMMGKLIDSLRSKGPTSPAVDPAVPVDDQGPAPLSFTQQFYWDTSQTPEQAVQHTVIGHFRLIGSLNERVLHDALQQLHERHEMLRTVFGVLDGQAVQIVEPPSILPLPRFDVSGDPDPIASAQALMARQREHRFELERPPLIRFALIRMSEREHWLTIACHHIIIDGWSLRIFGRELAESYDARINDVDDICPPAQQFGDFARWQRKEFHPGSPRYREALAGLIDEHVRGAYPGRATYRRLLLWWVRRSYPERSTRTSVLGLVLRTMCAVPPPPGKLLPFQRRAPPPVVDAKEGFIGWRFSPAVADRLDGIGRHDGATHAAVRMALCTILVSDAIGSSMVPVGSRFTNRSQPQARNVFGLCANPMTFVLHCDHDSTFRFFVRLVGERIRGLQQQSSFPYDELQRMMRAWKIKPLRNVVAINIATASAAIRVKDLEVLHVFTDNDVPPANVEFRLAGANDERENLLRFNAQVYDPAAMRDFVSDLIRFSEVASCNPDLRLTDLLAMSRLTAR